MIVTPFMSAGRPGRLFLHRGIRPSEDSDQKQSKRSLRIGSSSALTVQTVAAVSRVAALLTAAGIDSCITVLDLSLHIMHDEYTQLVCDIILRSIIKSLMYFADEAL